MEMTDTIERFEIRVDDAVLADLRTRLAQTRFPDQIEGTGWEYGIPLDYLRELVEYWRDEYDWRAQEARLNELDALPHRASTASRSTSSTRARRTRTRCRCSSPTAGPARSSSSSTSSRG